MTVGFTTRPVPGIEAVVPDGWESTLGGDGTGALTGTARAASAVAAARNAVDALAGRARAVGLELDVTSVRAEDARTRAAGAVATPYPPVVGYAEIAQIAGVSRQRAWQLARNTGFPPPVLDTGYGPLYDERAVRAWLAARDPRPGRPRRAHSRA